MAEDGMKVENPTPSRRDVIKKGAAVTTAAVALGALGAREMQVMEHGLETRDGTFFPLYERHDVGIQTKDIPQNLDVFFRELTMDEVAMELPAVRLAKAAMSFGIKTPSQQSSSGDKPGESFKKDAFEMLAQNGTKIAYGDVPPRSIDFSKENWHEKATIDEFKVGTARTAAGVIAAITGPLVKDLAEIDEKYGKKTIGTTSRRMLGKVMVGAGIGLATPPIAGFAISLGTRLVNPDLGQKNAITRIRNRLDGMLSHAVPENDVIFFRNLVMANKLLTLAKTTKKEGGKPRIAFNVGAAHGGIEDLLLAGQDVTRFLISRFPKWYMKPMIDRSGGVENFSSIRVLTLPKDMKKGELDENEYEANQRIGDERIIDQGLFEDLSKIFAPEINAHKDSLEKDFGAMRPTLQKHLNEGMYKKVSDAFEKTKFFSERDFKGHVRTNTLSGGEGDLKDTTFRQLNLSLPDHPLHPSMQQRYDDIEISTQEKAGKTTYESISFWVDSEGQLVPNNHRADLIVVPREKLVQTIQNALKDTPKDSSSWSYTRPGADYGAGHPLPGQGAMDAEIKSDGVTKLFHISQDGHVKLTVFTNSR